MNREEIMGFLPHRPPMMLLDELSLDDQGLAHGLYRVRGDEAFLQGHFPGFPVVPGVVLCEIIAQSAGALVEAHLREGYTPLFAGIDSVRFKRMVRPGDIVHTICEPLRISGQLIKVKGSAMVAGDICAQGVFLMMLSQVA